MSLNIKKGFAGAVITALAAGAIALTAAAPATADTSPAAAGPSVMAAADTCPVVQDSEGWTITGAVERPNVVDDGFHTMANGSGEAYYIRGDVWLEQRVTLSRAIPVQAGVTYTFNQSLLMNGGGDHNARSARDVIVSASINADEQFSISTASTALPIVTDGAKAIDSQTPGAVQTYSYTATSDTTITLSMTWDLLQVTNEANVNNDVAMTLPTISCDLPQVVCSDGLTAEIENVTHPSRSAVLSGTGKAGETITVTTPNGPVTTVVPANGNWTTTVSNLADGNNALTVNSSDNCAPVALSVIIDPLQVPIMHPAAAAGAAVLGLGAFGFGGLLRRRNTARI